MAEPVSASAPHGRSEPVSAVKDGIIGAAADLLAAAAWSVDSFAYLAGQSGLYEIQASAIALRRSQRQDIKAAAEEMIADHEDIASKLGSFLGAIDGAKPPPADLDEIHRILIDDLEDASDEDFHHRFLAQQKDAHEAAIILFKSYMDHGGNSALRNLCKLGLPVLEKHLEMIRHLNAD